VEAQKSISTGKIPKRTTDTRKKQLKKVKPQSIQRKRYKLSKDKDEAVEADAE